MTSVTGTAKSVFKRRKFQPSNKGKKTKKAGDDARVKSPLAPLSAGNLKVLWVTKEKMNQHVQGGGGRDKPTLQIYHIYKVKCWTPLKITCSL